MRSRDPWGAVVCLCVYLSICLFGCLVGWLFVCFLISPHFLWISKYNTAQTFRDSTMIYIYTYVLCTDRVSNEGASFVQNSQVSLIPSWSTRHENSTEAHLENVKEKLCPPSLKRKTNYHCHYHSNENPTSLKSLHVKISKRYIGEKCNQKGTSNTSSSSMM